MERGVNKEQALRWGRDLMTQLEQVSLIYYFMEE